MPTLIDNSTVDFDDGTLGEAFTPYIAQTFVAEGYGMHSVGFYIDAKGPNPTHYHVLITEVIEDETGFHPGRILTEVTGLSHPVAGGLEMVSVDLDGIRLNKDATYAFVIDGYTPREGLPDGADFGFNDDYADGYFAWFSSPLGFDRDADFANDWTEMDQDLAFTASFSDMGETITGTKKDDKKLKGTSDDDMIVGKKGNDTAKGKDGFDTLIGGKNKDILKGGKDGDLLIGGKHRDELHGQDGYDCYLFDFKMTEKSAKKHWDKLYNYEVGKDAIHLKQAYFSDLALGEVASTDPHIELKKSALFYNDVKFVKFKGDKPSSLDEIDIIVVA